MKKKKNETTANKSRSIRDFSIGWWKGISEDARKAPGPAKSAQILLEAVDKYVAHLSEAKYDSSAANAARRENAKKGGRPAGSKNKAPRSDKGIPRKHKPLQ